MKRQSILTIGLMTLALVGCKNTEKKETTETVVEEVVTEVAEAKKIMIKLEAKSGSTATGMVTFTEENGQVKMEAHINGLTPGEHAIHIHESSDCSAADGTSTGGHWNPTFQPHGKWGSEEGYHRGDIGNFTADESGHGMITMTTDQWCLGCEDETKNIIGKAIIVHAGVDDFVTRQQVTQVVE